MTPERWQEVKEMFAEALEQKPAERAAYLDKVCADAALRREVELMIAAYERGGSGFMEQPAHDTGLLQSGTTLGPYEILARIGAGGMGVVYRARDTRLNRIVAIKILPPHLADSPESRDRFEREARVIASLNHPHICTLYDVGHQDDADYLVMEFLEGETLASRLVKGSLPLEQTLRYAIQIADALDKAHRKGVTHRDLKPGNIMLTKSGAKLLDFGWRSGSKVHLPRESHFPSFRREKIPSPRKERLWGHCSTWRRSNSKARKRTAAQISFPSLRWCMRWRREGRRLRVQARRAPSRKFWTSIRRRFLRSKP
jgi:serine/threonine protein kinase